MKVRTISSSFTALLAQVLLIIILCLPTTFLFADSGNPETPEEKVILIEKSITEAEKLAKDGKLKKAITILESTIPKARVVNDADLLEKIYGRLLGLNTKIKNATKIEEYEALISLVRSQRENKQLKERTEEEEVLLSKIALEKDELSHQKDELSLKEKAKEIENEFTREQLKSKDLELNTTRDSLGMLDLINRERESQINLLNKERELKDLKVKEQELLIEEKEALHELTIVIIGALIIVILTVGVLAFFIYKNFRQKKTYSDKIESQLGIIKHQHENITSSINYAQRIQNSMLPSEKYLNELIPESFILFKPKDIVSGDFYWFHKVDQGESSLGSKILIAAVDCTGHGVPGAFMSMIGYNALNMIASKKIFSPELVLTELNTSIRSALQQHQNDNNDGMDMALCLIDHETRTVEFAGAKNPIIIIKNGELEVIKGDKHPIGGSQGGAERSFTKHVISIDQPTSIYLLSDGYEDQFGGAENRKFMIKNLKELLLTIHHESFEKQKSILKKTIEDWIGEGGKQIDDILALGMKLG